MSCCCDWTPKALLEKKAVDVFEYAKIFDPTLNCYNALWNMYRYRVLGIDNFNYWIQMFKDRVDNLSRKYSLSFQAYEQNLLKLKDLDNITYNMSTDETFEGDVHTQSEDIPDTPIVEGDEYLDMRGDRKESTFRAIDQGYKGSTSMTVDALNNLINKMPDPYVKFAEEFRTFFVGVWI